MQQDSGFVSTGNGYNLTRGIPTDETRFLRGIQTSNANGEVKFRTIYPGLDVCVQKKAL